MAELEGAVASVVGVATVGVKLSRTLYQVGHGIAAPDHSIHRIAANVSTYSLALRRLASILKGPQSPHTSTTLDDLAHVLKDSGAVFQDFTTLVLHAKDKSEPAREPVPANGRRRRHSVVARVKWYFEQPYIDVLIAQLDYLRATIVAMIKTMEIAASTTQSGPCYRLAAADFDDDRLHLETLIIAQQLSIAVMCSAQQRYSDLQDTQTGETLPEIERATEQRYPKLLTQSTASPMEPIRLCDDSLDFLDQRSSTLESEDDAHREPSTSRSEHVIDRLLQVWTIDSTSSRPSFELVTSRAVDLGAVDLPGGQATANVHDEAVSTSGEHTPEIKVAVVDPSASNASRPPAQPIPQSQWLRPDALPPRTARSPQPLELTPHSLPEHDSKTSAHAVGPIPGSHASALDRQVQFGSRSGTPQPPSNTEYATRDLPRDRSNYRRPHVSSESSSAASSDSEDVQSTRGHRRSSISSKHSHHDSGIGDGLDIPWRIRISPAKYFDFRDAKLVGPRTPYLPSEPRHWVYSHDNAATEISKQWVSEEAILEKKYAYTELREEPSTSSIGGDEGAWRVLQPLRFTEVEALVSRTIENFRQRTPAPPASPSRPSRPPPGQQAPHPRGYSYQAPPPAPLPQPQAQHRSVSFNDAMASGPRPPGPAPYGRPPPSPQGWARRERERERDAPPHGHHHHHHHRDRERERERERDRPSSRGGKAHRHRDGRERKDDKRKSSTIPMTLAKIGGLAALLEGLDGAF